MASAFALAIFSGIGFLFGIQKSLRAFLNPLFTSRVVTENGICSAAFCESAALWAASSPSQALTRQLSQRESLLETAHSQINSSSIKKKNREDSSGMTILSVFMLFYVNTKVSSAVAAHLPST